MTADRTEPTALPEIPACLCSHMWVWHIDFDATAGRCDVAACGCNRYRADDTRRRIDQELYDPSPAPIDRKTR